MSTSAQNQSKCRAQDPLTCRYHGSLLRMEEALTKNDYDSYHSAKEEFLKATPEPKLSAQPALPGDEISAEMSRAYAHYSIANDHMHNGTDVGNQAEILYYSSPQGQLELKRRSNTRFNKEYTTIQEEIDHHKGSIPYHFGQDESYIKKQVEQGEKDIAVLSTYPLEDSQNIDLQTPAVRHYLAEESQRWLKLLTTEQQEAISWITSNGFKVAQYAVEPENNSSTMGAFDGVVDEEAILDKYPLDYEAGEAAVLKAQKQYAQKFLKTVHKAFEKAPRLKQPITISRGTTFLEVADILGTSSDSYSQIMDHIERGDYSGKSISSKARMRKLPMSASVSPFKAQFFAKNIWDSKNGDIGEKRKVVIQIKAKSSTSPVNVGAWGSTEFEMLTNPQSDYAVIGGRRVADDLFVLDLEEK